MPILLKLIGVVAISSFFLLADFGDFAHAKKSTQPDPPQVAPAQPPPAQPVPELPAQNHAATTASDTSTCYPLMGLCFSNKVDSALIGTIIIFLITIIVNSHRDRNIRKATIVEEVRKQSDIRQRYLLELKEEIELNIQGLSDTVRSWPPRHEICKFLQQSPQHRPIINFSYSSVIFRNRTEVLQDLPDMLINNIVAFYGRLDALTGDVASVEGIEFRNDFTGGSRKHNS